LGWLVLMAVLGFLQMPVDPLAFSWGPVPIPLALLLGGVVVGWLLALLSRVAAGVGARRRRTQVEERLDEAIDEAAFQHVRRPVMAVLDRHEKTRQLLEQAAA